MRADASTGAAERRRRWPRRAWLVPVAVIAALLGALPAVAADGAGTAERRLAERYAPIVSLKRQAKACDRDGEAYRPVPVETVLGRDDVRLVDGTGALLTSAPTAADLFGRPDDTYLDFPGSPLRAGCAYEKWFRRIAADAPTTAYAHLVGEPGEDGLALQYWLYYPFNDFNNKHESDWEMIQLLFDASTAEEALAQEPVRIGYSQHEGAEQAGWESEKLERDGDHPVVYPGAGSHANYFSARLWLGHSASEGFGCDDTRAPTVREPTRVVLLPSTPPAAADTPFAWLAYEGHWGQRASGPNNGPTGPNRKGQWTEPLSWADDEWRDGSTAVPLTRTLGTSATGFFCDAVASVSGVYLHWLRSPFTVLGVLALVVAGAVWLSRRTRWRPATPLPVRRARSAGELFVAAARLYRRYAPLFLGIGIVFVPVATVAMILQEVVFDVTRIGALVHASESDPFAAVVIPLLVGSLGTIAATVAVAGAGAAALARIDGGERPDALDAYRALVPRLGALAVASLRIVLVTTLLVVSVVGIPLAVLYLVRRSLVTQAIVLEGSGAAEAVARSSALVRGRSWRVLAVTGLANTVAALLGPLAGVALLFLTSSSLAVVNGVSSLVYAVVMPYVALVLALLYHDLTAREPGREPASA